MGKKTYTQVLVRDMQIADLASLDVPAMSADSADILRKECIVQAKAATKEGFHLKATKLYTAGMLFALASERVIYSEVVELIDLTRNALRMQSTPLRNNRVKTRAEIDAHRSYL